MKLLEGNIPQRKRKPRETPLDHFEPYTKLKAIILNGKMEPNQQIGILFEPSDCRTLGMKAPWRTMADRLRKLLEETGLSKDYDVIKYETQTPGWWFVRVTYTPSTKFHGNKKSTR
jgi:hypothetical protein